MPEIMSYVTEKIAVEDDVADQIRSLFGSVDNAQKKLRLRDIPYHDMAAALKGRPVKERYADDILDAWRAWKRLYLRGYTIGLPQDIDFRLPRSPEELETRMEAVKALEVEEAVRTARMAKRASKKK